jgi:hypothetical protein
MKTQTIEDWAVIEVAAHTPVPAPKGIAEDAIRAKVAAGLTRRQAIQALQAQAANDAAKAKPAKAKAK